METIHDVNTIAYLTPRFIRKFEKFLNPSKCKTKRSEWQSKFTKVFNKFFVKGINMPMDMKLHFSAFLMLYPMSEKESSVFFKLSENNRLGYLTKFMIKKSHSCKVPNAVLSRYTSTKSRYSEAKRFGYTTNMMYSYKERLTLLTYMILEICYDNNTRSGKLDLLLSEDY